MSESINIQRINNYTDVRFSKKVLCQHGAFLINDEPYSVEILSNSTAIVHGENKIYFERLIEEFIFYSPHIYIFCDEKLNIIKKYSKPEILKIAMENIQPSQFYIDLKKINAIETFIKKLDDIIIQVQKFGDKYIALDGHTRLYYAVLSGFTNVYGVPSTAEPYIYDFVKEATNRNIRTPYDLKSLSHQEYEKKWIQYCNKYFNNHDYTAVDMDVDLM